MIDLSKGDLGGTDIAVTVEDGKTKSVVESRSAVTEKMLGAIVGLGKVLPTVGNSRRGVGDVGNMFALGYRSNKNANIYDPTNKPDIGDAMAAASSAVGKYSKFYWPGEYNGIRAAEKLKTSTSLPLEQTGGKDGPGNALRISRNLGNSLYVDEDKSRSLAIWVEEVYRGERQNWYFIFTDLSVNGSKRVVIIFFHGAVIAWDGSKLGIVLR